MTRVVLTALLVAGLAANAAADVTVKQTTTGKGLGMSGSASGTTYIKGAKMRTELVTGDTTRTTILDLDTQKMISFDNKKKEADVWNMQAIGAEVGERTDLANLKASITPNGQTRQIGGKTANGYDMNVSMPASMPGGKDMSLTVTLSGPVWIVKNAPGAADYANFYKQAAEKGFIFSDPRAAKGSPGQAKAITEMHRKLAEIGGIAYETEMTIKMDGSGPMAGLMAKMGGVQSTVTVTDVAAGPLADDLFAVPAGYQLKERK